MQNDRKESADVAVSRVKMLVIHRPPSRVPRRPSRSAMMPWIAAPIRNPTSPLEINSPAWPGCRPHGFAT